MRRNDVPGVWDILKGSIATMTTITATKSTPSGIVYRETLPVPEPPKRWPLEITDEEASREVGQMFEDLLNHRCLRVNNNFLLDEDGKMVVQSRNAMVLSVARQLLGSEWRCDE